MSSVPSSVRSRRLPTSVVALMLAVLWLPCATSARAASSPARLAGLAPVGSAAVLPPGAHPLGALAAGTRLTIDVALAPRGGDALVQAAASARRGHRPGRRTLSLAGFRARFSPTPATLRRIRAILRESDLPAGSLSANGLTLTMTTSAARLDRALHLRLVRVRLSDGTVAYANLRAPRLPASVAASVQGVVGLDDLQLPHPLGLLRAPRRHRAAITFPGAIGATQAGAAAGAHVGADPGAASAVSDCSGALVASADFGAYSAGQVADAYGLSSLYAAGDEGAGETVALMEFEPFLGSDISAFNACYGIDNGSTSDVSVIPVRAGWSSGAGSGPGEGEAALDIEQILGLAPAASVAVYEAPNDYAGLINAYSAMVANPAVDVISTSWGECEPAAGSSTARAEATIFAEAAVQGESVFASAGDSGSSDCANGGAGTATGAGAPAVDDPGSQPDVTSVGGTTLPGGQVSQQSTWNESAAQLGAGGGGISSLWPMPAYQSAAASTLNVLSANSSGAPCGAGAGGYCREVPDVSADADPTTGYDVFYSGGWTAFGGTSAAAPLWAALTALANASPACGGHTIGFANPALYGVADSASEYAADFTDVQTGTNDYTPAGYLGGLFPAGIGFDMATGLGTPDAATLAPDLCRAAAGLGSAAKTVPISAPPSAPTTSNAPAASGASGGAGGATTMAGAGSAPTTGTAGTGAGAGTTGTGTPVTGTGTSGGGTDTGTGPGTAGAGTSGSGTTSTPTTGTGANGSGSGTGSAAGSGTTTSTSGGSGASSSGAAGTAGAGSPPSGGGDSTCRTHSIVLRAASLTFTAGPGRGQATWTTHLRIPAGCHARTLVLQRRVLAASARQGRALTLALVPAGGRSTIVGRMTSADRGPAGMVTFRLPSLTGDSLSLRCAVARGGAGTTRFTLAHLTLTLS